MEWFNIVIIAMFNGLIMTIVHFTFYTMENVESDFRNSSIKYGIIFLISVIFFRVNYFFIFYDMKLEI